MSEQWKSVIGYEGIYEVSNLGRVKSILQRRGMRAGHILAQRLDSRGLYLLVDLKFGGTRRTVRVHRLVGEAFFGELPHGMHTRHLNGDPRDNRLENLRYGTPAENSADSIAHGTHHGLAIAARTHCNNGHKFTDASTEHAANGYRICRKCDVAKSIAWQRRDLARREGTGEVTPHLVRLWASGMGLIRETGRLSNDIKWFYALSHPDCGWEPTPDPRTKKVIKPSLRRLIEAHPEWSDAIATRELRAA